MEYKIRGAQKSDLDSIYKLLTELTSQPPDRDIFHKTFGANVNLSSIEYWVLEVGNDIAGFISIHTNNLLHHDRPVHEIQEFIVDPSFRRKGLGKAMMTFVLNRFSGGIIELSSNKKRIKAKMFYERMGFNGSHHKFVYFKKPE